MKKYWNALRYGNAKTKRILICAILLFLFAGTGGVLAASGSGVLWGLTAVFAFVMDIVLLQSVRFGETELVSGRAKDKKKAILAKSFDSLTDITKEDLEELLIAYRVNSAHVQVMIDSYEKEGVKQTPAYLWKAKGYLQLLVLENKPRNLAIPMSQVTKITYMKNVEVNPLAEYGQVRQPSVVSAMYQPLLPVYKERQAGARRYYTKNLYVIEPGIRITNTSVKNVRPVLRVPIVFTGVVDDRYGKYYQAASEMKILLMDQVLTSDEYKAQISGMLKRMADGGATDAEFQNDLALMVRARLVTQEVAQYFMDYRRKQEKAKKK